MATITAVEKARLTVAFETLGPERVARGLRASGLAWDECFLVRAVEGDLEGFAPALRRHCSRQRLGCLEPELQQHLVRLWNRDEAGFRALALEWLEEHPASSGHPLPAARPRRVPPSVERRGSRDLLLLPARRIR